MIKKLILVLLMVLPASATPEADKNMKAYPEAEKGMTRHVLKLPKEADETAMKVELIVGKTVETDGTNRHFFAGKLESQTIKGWGFNYHILPKLGPMAGTLMAPRPGAAKKKEFVPVGGQPYIIRYNSRLPIVVYVPEGVEVRYRLWRADPKPTEVEEG